jgi:excisionase family DNA binding protein
MKTSEPERLAGAAILTVVEVAALLRISINTARALIADGTIPATKVGRQWRIRRVDLDAMLEPL